MKRVLLAIAAILFLALASPTLAATLIDGSQINRSWTMVNGIGLKVYGTATNTAFQSSGGLLIRSGGAGTTTFYVDASNRWVGVRTASPKTALEILGTASGSEIHATQQLRSSGSLSVSGAATFKSSSFRLLDSGFANCTALETSSGILTCGTDADTTYLFGQGLTLTSSTVTLSSSFSGTSLEIFGTSSGRQVYAADALRSSGSLIVTGASSLKNDLTLGGGNLNFTEATTIGDGGDALIINSSGTMTVQDILDISDNNMVNVGDIALDSLSSDAGTSISVSLGSDAGDDFIVDSTGLVYEGDNNRVGIGTAAPKTTLEIQGTASGSEVHATRQLRSSGSLSVAGTAVFKNSSFKLLDAGFADCSALETVSGVLTCGSDAGTTFTAGQGLTLNGSNAFNVNATLTGTLVKFTTLSGATLKAGFGTVSTPSHTFHGDSDTGLYWISANTIGIAVGGAKIGQLNSTGLSVNGTASGKSLLIADGPNRINGTTTISGSTTIRQARILRFITVQFANDGTACATGSGAPIPIPPYMNNFTLSGAVAVAGKAGTTNSLKIQMRNKTQSLDMFSQQLTVFSSATVGSGSINTSNNRVATNDVLVPYISAVSTTPQQGCSATFTFAP